MLSEIIPCNKLHKLNELANSATCLTKLNLSKHQAVYLLCNSFIKHINDYTYEFKKLNSFHGLYIVHMPWICFKTLRFAIMQGHLDEYT